MLDVKLIKRLYNWQKNNVNYTFIKSDIIIVMSYTIFLYYTFVVVFYSKRCILVLFVTVSNEDYIYYMSEVKQ